MKTQTWRQSGPGIVRHLFVVALFSACIAIAFDANAQAFRRFEMALFDSSDPNYTDLRWFSPEQSQPAGRSILVLDGYYSQANYPNLQQYLRDKGFDWTRIAATVIDEPYWYAAIQAGGSEDWTTPCYYYVDVRCLAVYDLMPQIEATAVAVKQLAQEQGAMTRFWINFSEPEIQWMQDYYSPLPLNQPYIDVISLDKYHVQFNQVKPYYDWLVNNRAKPSQQFALVPGVFHAVSPNYTSPATAASNLAGFFNYANTVNDNYDQPAVWLVAGWIGRGDEWDGDIGNNVFIRGIYASSSAQILTTWWQQFVRLKLNKLSGYMDSADTYSMVVTGWAVDRTTMQSPWVDMYLDGQYVATALANQHRPDVGAIYGPSAAGFSLSIPWYYNDGGCHSMQLYAIAYTAESYNHVMITNTYICFGWW